MSLNRRIFCPHDSCPERTHPISAIYCPNTGKRIAINPPQNDKFGVKVVMVALVLTVISLTGVYASYERNKPWKKRAEKVAIHSDQLFSSLPTERVLTLYGSNTIGAKLAPALAEAFLKKNGASQVRKRNTAVENEQIVEGIVSDNVYQIAIAAHGSSTGFKALKSGECDVGMASRRVKSKEVQLLKDMGNMRSRSNEHVLGLDGLAVIVNQANPISSLSIDQLAAIFKGEIRNWNEVGGPNGPIQVYARDDKSGTFDTFNSLVMRKSPLIDSAKRYESNAQLSDEVSQDKAGIGFTGLPYVRNSKPLAIESKGADKVIPTFFTVGTEDYPLTRRLYLYSATAPENPFTSAFIGFALSSEGQALVKQIGFVDLNIKTFGASIGNNDRIKNKKLAAQFMRSTAEAEKVSVSYRFQPGSLSLDNRSTQDLDRFVNYIKGKDLWEKEIILVGYSDGKNYRESLENSKKRARIIAKELQMRGIRVSKVLGLGEEAPVASSDTDEGRFRNRRVEVWIKG